MFTHGRRLAWVVGAYTLIVWLHMRADGLGEWLPGGALSFRWVYGTGYFLLGALGYGVCMRAWPGLAPAFGRAATLLAGALLAALDAFLLAPPAGGTRLELWMTALLGLALATVSARLAPAPVARSWTGGSKVDAAGRTRADPGSSP